MATVIVFWVLLGLRCIYTVTLNGAGSDDIRMQAISGLSVLGCPDAGREA